MSDNLRMLGKYSAAMDAGDTEAVFEFWADDFVSHVTARVNPERVGSDVRGDEQQWWQQVRSAFPDMTFTVNLLLEAVEHDDLVAAVHKLSHEMPTDKAGSSSHQCSHARLPRKCRL